MIGEAKDHINAAVEELEHAKHYVEATKTPLDTAINAFGGQLDTQEKITVAAQEVTTQINALKARIGMLGALLLDGKLAAAEVAASGEAVQSNSTTAYHHARAARSHVIEATGEPAEDITSVGNHIKGLVGIGTTLKNDGSAAATQFGTALETAQGMLDTVSTLETSAQGLVRVAARLGYRGEAGEYFTDVPFYPEQTVMGIEQTTQALRDRADNW